MECIFNTGFLFFHFTFCCCTNIYLGNTTSEFCETLFQLFTVVVTGCILNFSTNLFDSRLDVGCFTTTFDNGCIVLIDNDLLGTTQLGKADVLEFHPKIFKDSSCSCEDGNVFEHGLSAITVSWRLDGRYLEGAPQTVDYQRGKCFSVDFFRHNQHWLTSIHNSLQQWNNVLHCGDLLLINKDVAVFKDALHGLCISNEVGREVPSVELHALDELNFCCQAFAFVNGNDSVLADFIHRFCKQVTDLGIIVCCDGCNLGHLFLTLYRDCRTVEFCCDVFNSFFNSSLHLDWIDSSNNGSQSFIEDGLGENSCRCRTITSNITGLTGDFTHHAGTHIFVGVFKVNFLCNGNTILGNRWRTETLLENHVSTLWTECDFDCTGQFGDTSPHCFAGFLIKRHHFGHRMFLLY